MHYIIGLITAIAGLLWAFNALQRSGFNASSLNPFAFYRRWQWRRQYADKPLYCLRDPTEVAAVLLLGVAKCKGELTVAQKAQLNAILREDLALPPPDADDLLVASSFLLRDEVYVVDKLDRVLALSKEKFSAGQRQSLLALMRHLANTEGGANPEQEKLIARASELLRA